MSEKIGIVLKKIRGEKNLTRQQICNGLISESEYQNIETGKSEGNVWIQKLLLGRLHIPESTVTFYLNLNDNEMVNLETEIYRRIMVWKYDEAEKKLHRFYNMTDKLNTAQMLIYYKLYLLVYGHRNRVSKNEFEVIAERLGKLFSEIKMRLHERECLSPDELSFITEYYACFFTDIRKKSESLYEIMDYYRNEYNGTENQNRFYAQLCFYYAQGQYELKEYHNCLNSCKEGLKVTALFGNCNTTAELLELVAYSKECLIDKNDLANIKSLLVEEITQPELFMRL